MQSIFKKNLFLFAIFISNVALGNADQTLATADSLFINGRYVEAFDHYEDLYHQDLLSPAMLIKMAYIKEGLGQIDDALYYLNIYYLKTADKEVLVKMEELAEANDLYGYEAGDFEYFISYYYKYYQLITIFLIALVLLSFAMLFYYKRRGLSRPIGPGVIMTILLCLLFYQVNSGKIYNKGIISGEPVYLMEGPSAGAKVIDVVSAGHRIQIEDYQDVWVQVQWDDKTAFVKNKNIRDIEFF